MDAYNEVLGFADVYLEDSWVLGVTARPGEVVLDIEAVLLKGHPAYTPPRPGEAHCYRPGRIVFRQVTAVTWTDQSAVAVAVDASGEKDYGAIDVFVIGDTCVLEGDFGRLEVESTPPVLELGL